MHIQQRTESTEAFSEQHTWWDERAGGGKNTGDLSKESRVDFQAGLAIWIIAIPYLVSYLIKTTTKTFFVCLYTFFYIYISISTYQALCTTVCPACIWTGNNLLHKWRTVLLIPLALLKVLQLPLLGSWSSAAFSKVPLSLTWLAFRSKECIVDTKVVGLIPETLDIGDNLTYRTLELVIFASGWAMLHCKQQNIFAP